MICLTDIVSMMIEFKILSKTQFLTLNNLMRDLIKKSDLSVRKGIPFSIKEWNPSGKHLYGGPI